MQKVCGNGALRVTVEGGGCSGFQYLFSLEETVDASDNDEDM
jgi:Fe-S cluster assembly iron-binding protein IscA